MVLYLTITDLHSQHRDHRLPSDEQISETFTESVHAVTMVRCGYS